jgi:hypothetical protein
MFAAASERGFQSPVVHERNVMNGRSTIRLLGLLLLCLSVFGGAGCASFSKSKLPTRTLAEFENEGRLIGITYDFADVGGFGAASLPAMSTAPTTPSYMFQSRVQPIFRRAFAEATWQKAPGEWHLDIYYRETARNPAVTYTLVLFFIASLGFLPAYSEDDLYLEVKLRHNGETVKQYIYEESVATWMHWFVLPWAFSDDPMETKTAILENMILNLLHELRTELPRAEPAR